MKARDIQIYILKLADNHETENLNRRFKALEYLTGFTGSNGKAIVIHGLNTKHCKNLDNFNNPYLYTDERYYIQTKKQLQSPWSLVKEVYEIFDKVFREINSNSECLNHYINNNINIYTDTSVMGLDFYKKFMENVKFKNADKYVKFNVDENIDFIKSFWKDRPLLPNTEIFVHEYKYSGEQAISKINTIKSELQSWKVTNHSKKAVLVVELDDIAWILNLRASDTEYSPMFYSYLYISNNEIVLFVDQKRPNFYKIKQYLQKLNIIIKNYNMNELHEFLKIKKSQDYYVYCDMLKYDIYHILKENVYYPDFYDDYSKLPIKIKFRKSVRNKISLESETNSLFKDSIALIQYFSWLSNKYSTNIDRIIKCKDKVCKKQYLITEYEGVLKLEEFKKSKPLYFGPAFDTISASGANAAMVHYMPTSDEHDFIEWNQMYMVDQGGNYLDGTTDITRTIQFFPENTNVPQKFKDAYTLVLKGNISLIMTIFDYDTPQTVFNDMGNKYLPASSQGTVGHGIGQFLSEHEYPPGTYYGYPIYNNQVISDEPSLEIENVLGVRIEDDLVAKVIGLEEKETLIKDWNYYSYKGKGGTKYVKFDNMSLVPFDLRLIDFSKLDLKEKEYINHYHQRVREYIRPKLIELKDDIAIKWLDKNTRHIQ